MITKIWNEREKARRETRDHERAITALEQEIETTI
jgi:hypothetical protein